jgi:hypothetical protein
MINKRKKSKPAPTVTKKPAAPKKPTVKPQPVVVRPQPVPDGASPGDSSVDTADVRQTIEKRLKKVTPRKKGLR